MTSTPAADVTLSLSSRRYPVLFQSQGMRTPTSDLSHTQDGHRGEPVELSALLELHHGKVYLHLTCRTCKATLTGQPGSTPSTLTGAATTNQRRRGPSQPSLKRRLFSVPLGKRWLREKVSRETSSEKGDKHARAASTSSASAPRHYPKQQYTIALVDILPLAAQLPLSAKLRSRLHLDLHDRDTVTYSSHSTPRTPFVRLASFHLPRTPSVLSSSACPLPIRSPLFMSSQTRDSNLSARPASSRHAGSTAVTYGQYLDVAEPFRSNVRSPPSPLLIPSSKGMGRLQSSSCSIEGAATKAQHSPLDRTSQVPRETGSGLLTSYMEKTCAPQKLPVTPRGGLGLGASTPSQTQTMDVSLETANALVEDEELLCVTLVGVTETTQTRRCSVSDDEGHARRGERCHRCCHRKLPWSLLRFVFPEKDLQRSKSAGTVATTSDVRDEGLQGSAVRPQPPRRALSPPRKSRHSAWSPVRASSADTIPQRVPDLPFALHRAETFCLRFLGEDDLRDFLRCYVAMRTWAKEVKEENAAIKRRATADRREDGVGKSGAPRVVVNDTDNVVSSEYEVYLGESAMNSHDSPSTAAYHENPRNTASLRPKGCPLFAENSDDLLGNSPHAVSDESGDGHHDDEHAAAYSALTSRRNAAFDCRGWQDYVRHAADPRYGIAYAAVPLFLWHSFLPLASSALYTCHRGFLIVERFPPPSSPVYSENGGLNVSGAEHDSAPDASLQHWNDLVYLLLAPIRTLREVAPAATQPLQLHAPPKSKSVAKLPPAPEGSATSQASSAPASTTASGWDGTHLVLPSANSALCQSKEDYLTTFKDVFLCLSESHLLFMDSFGQLRFSFSFDEIALMTHSAATDSFPTHPFVRFRLKTSEYFGTPTFVLTFLLIPDVPHRLRVPHAAASLRPPETEPTTLFRSAPLTSSPSASARGTAPVVSHHPPGASVPETHSCVGFLEDEEKQRLLCRHQTLLDTFQAVCPRLLERCTLSELMSGESGKSHSAHLRQLISCASNGLSSSTLVSSFSNARTGASPWVAHRYDINAILCVRINAGDISFANPEAPPREGACLTATSLPLSLRCFSARQRQASWQRSPSAQAVPSGSPTSSFANVTLRWGRDDPGIVLRDAGQDMDFSLERATRAMPLLVSKEAVSQYYGASLKNSLPRSLSPSYSSSDSREAKERRVCEGAKDSGSTDTGDTYVPIAPTKQRSSIVRRTALKGR